MIITVKTAFKHFFCFVSHYTGLNRLYARCFNRSAARIILYHKVNDDINSFFPPVTIRHFKEHIEYLAENYSVVSLSGIAGFAGGRTELPERSVAVTFDDGYSDIYENVLPFIKKHGYPVTVFLTSDCVKNQSVMWTDRLHQYFLRTTVKQIKLDIPDGVEFYLRNFEERKKACLRIKEYLKSVDEGEKHRIFDLLREKLSINVDDDMPELMLTESQAVELNKSGVEIGSHSMTHPVLTKITGDKAREEIVISKAIIEKMIGSPVSCFSYPAGIYSAPIKNEVINAGYLYACGVGGGMVHMGDDIFALNRIYITDCPVYIFAVEVSGLMNFFRRIVSRGK